MMTAAHALAESFAVLTRLPAPYRISPADALALLDNNFIGRTRVVALDAYGYQALLRRAGAKGISGGRIYDAIIAACALKAGAATLLTFNASHFEGDSAAGLMVMTPSLRT